MGFCIKKKKGGKGCSILSTILTLFFLLFGPSALLVLNDFIIVGAVLIFSEKYY